MGGGQGAGKETMVGDREAPREGEECHRRPVGRKVVSRIWARTGRGEGKWEQPGLGVYKCAPMTLTNPHASSKK